MSRPKREEVREPGLAEAKSRNLSQNAPGSLTSLSRPEREQLAALAKAMRDWWPDMPWEKKRHMHAVTLAAITGDAPPNVSLTEAFCDAVSPAAVLALLGEIEQLERALEEAELTPLDYKVGYQHGKEAGLSEAASAAVVKT